MRKKDIQKYLCNWANIDVSEENAQELLLYEAEKEVKLSRHSHRWWDEVETVGKYGDKYFLFYKAHANRDESVEDLGWEFDWGSVEEVEPYEETITVIKYRTKN